MCRPFGKSTSEIRAASKAAGTISRQGKKKEKKKETVSPMFYVGTPKQVRLVFSEVESGYVRAYNFVC